MTSFQQISKRSCPASFPKDNLEEEYGIHQEQVYEVPQDIIIHSPAYSSVLTNFVRVPTMIMGQVIFNMQKQWCEFVDSACTEIDFSYIIYHEKHNKCYFFTDSSELKLALLYKFMFYTKFIIYKDRHLHIQKLNVDNFVEESYDLGLSLPAVKTIGKFLDMNVHLRESEINRDGFSD